MSKIEKKYVFKQYLYTLIKIYLDLHKLYYDFDFFELGFAYFQNFFINQLITL